MARFDGSGPMGKGAMTGRGMGYCAGDVYERPYYGRGMGRRPYGGRGFGRGMGRGFYRCGYPRYYVEDASYALDSKEMLKEEKAMLEERLNLLEKELENLKDK